MKITELKISLQEKTLVDISLQINKSLALVGQSGSGKSLTLKALLGMLPNTMNSSLDVNADFELKAGDTVSFVPQNPFTALSPLTKIYKQFFISEKKQRELFAQVGLDEELLDRFKRYFDVLTAASDSVKSNGEEYKEILELVGELKNGIRGQ